MSVDCGILTPRKTRFYSRPNKLKHKPLVRGFLSMPFHPPISVLPIRFSLYVFLQDILQRRLKTTRTRLFTQASCPYRRHFARCRCRRCEFISCRAFYYALPPSCLSVTPKESAQLCFYSNILHSLQGSILKFCFASSFFFFFLDYSHISYLYKLFICSTYESVVLYNKDSLCK